QPRLRARAGLHDGLRPARRDRLPGDRPRVRASRPEGEVVVTSTVESRIKTRAWVPAWSRRRNMQLWTGVVILGVIVLAAIFAPLLSGYDPTAPDAGNALQGPSGAHWLGTDHLGRDIFSRLVHGGRTDL